MLDGPDIAKIRLVLTSAGWNDVMRREILKRGNIAVKLLCLSPSERVGKESDEMLRATIRECEWMVSVWNNEIIAAEHNARLNELEGANGSSTANP